ncbi:hypothetical protein CDIK_0678 [Cucumispora dikerogammari]|nr:hypothetical protein CDIK_0678 [Cucumispora dikerogammari]
MTDLSDERKSDIKQEIIRDIIKDIVKEIRKEIKEEIKQEILHEIKQELMREYEEKNKKKIKRQDNQDECNEGLSAKEAENKAILFHEPTNIFSRDQKKNQKTLVGETKLEQPRPELIIAANQKKNQETSVQETKLEQPRPELIIAANQKKNQGTSVQKSKLEQPRPELIIAANQKKNQEISVQETKSEQSRLELIIAANQKKKESTNKEIEQEAGQERKRTINLEGNLAINQAAKREKHGEANIEMNQGPYREINRIANQKVLQETNHEVNKKPGQEANKKTNKEIKNQKTVLTFKSSVITLKEQKDLNFFEQKFESFKSNNIMDLHKIIESLDSKTFSKVVFNNFLKINNEKVLQSIFEKFFEIFFDPIFQSQNSKNSFNLLFEDSSYSNILHRKYVFFPYNFSIAIYQQKLLDAVQVPDNIDIKLLKRTPETKKTFKTTVQFEEEIPELQEPHNFSIRRIIKRLKNINTPIPEPYMQSVNTKLTKLVENISANETSDVGAPRIKKNPKNPVQKLFFDKSREVYSVILNPERFFDNTTKEHVSKLSNLYTQETLLYLSLLLRIMPFNMEEKLELIKEKNLLVKLLDAENYQVKVQTLITMFLFIDSVEVFEAYFDSFIDSLYDESDIVVDVASEFIKLLCFKYKSSIESEAFLSLDFMINMKKQKCSFKESKAIRYLLKDANLQLTLISCVNTDFKFLIYLYELENYSIQIKELIFCVRNNFEVLKKFFSQIFLNPGIKIEDVLNKPVSIGAETKIPCDVILTNSCFKQSIQTIGTENVVFIALLILFIECGLKSKNMGLTAAENKKN